MTVTSVRDFFHRVGLGNGRIGGDETIHRCTGAVSQKTAICAFGQRRTGIRFLRLTLETRVPEPLAIREIAVRP